MFISTSKPRVITSLILTASLFAFLILLKDEFLDDEVKSGTLLFVLCFVCSILIGTLTAIKFNFKPKKQNVVHTVILFLLPVVSMTMVECLNYCFIYDFYWVDFFTSYVLYILFYGLIFAFTGSYKLSVLIINPIFFIFGLANYYIYTFKGSPFVPMDFMSISTAKDVASSYDFSFTYQIAISVILLAAIIVIGSNLKTPKMHISGKLITRISTGAAIIIVSLIFPVDRSVAKAERFGRIPKYNKALVKMCRELKVEYLDSASVLKAHKECYGSDGIHQLRPFYEKHWLRFIMEEKGIY